MAWRLPKSEWERGRGAGNRRAMRKLVSAGEPVGLLAYLGETPVGWCSVSPRESFVRLESSRVIRPPDDRPAWSISCFFIAKEHRGRGISTGMLRLAAGYYRKQGVKILEGYPVIPYSPTMPGAFAWTGILSAFLEAGFTREKGRSKSRPIVRRYLTV
jgi:GNAT superfamily N-acetyltransferase